MSEKCYICGVSLPEADLKALERQMQEKFPGFTTDQCSLVCGDCKSRVDQWLEDIQQTN